MKITQRSADSLQIAISQLVVTGHVHQSHIIDQFTQPRCVGQTDSRLTPHKSVFGSVPILRIDVRQSRRTHVSHTATSCIRSDIQRRTAIWSKEGFSTCPQVVATEAKKLSIITSTPILNLLIICLFLIIFRFSRDDSRTVPTAL